MADDVAAIIAWRQGDFCLDVKRVPVLISEDQVRGVRSYGAVVISQSCDIARDIKDRPYVQVARIMEVDSEHIIPISRFREPKLAIIPALEDRCLVADLDIVATIHKNILLDWPRTQGCRDAMEQRKFSYAVGRHKHRPAFPDSWSPGLDELRRWVMKKGRKPGGDEGKFINALDQVRIRAENTETPDEIELIGILKPGWTDDDREHWATNMLPKMADLVDSQWCANVSLRLVDPYELPMGDYFESYRLDLEALTER